MTVVGRNFIFIHVPKSAGQSVTARLGGLTTSLPSHAPLFHLPLDVRQGRIAFGFVRNPWDRLVSVYAFVCNKRIKRNESAEYQSRIRAMGFEKWLLEDHFYIHQDRLWWSAALEPIQRRSQMFWLDGCDFIGRVERLDDDFASISGQLALRPSWVEVFGIRRNVPHRNKSRRGDYRSYYSDQSAEFVGKHFAPECERFGYEF
jgi:hypothetical protein